MSKYQKWALVLLRLATGWMMLYAGYTKLIDPKWSAAGYLKGALTFHGFYLWFTQPSVLPIINFINEWGLTLLGISLILGIGVRFSSFFGAILMMLYYFPVLKFPMIAPHSYIVDEHIMDTLVLLTLGAFRAGRVFGLENWFAGMPMFRKFRNLQSWWG